MKKLTICLSIFSFIFLLTSCSNTYTYKEDGPFITAYMAPVGPGIPEDLITEHITIYQNGTFILSDGNHDKGKDKPIVQLTLTEDEINEIQSHIYESRFKKLPEDVTAPSEDGAKYGIEVHFEKNSKLVAGWNPSNEAFNELHDYLFHFIEEETLQTWREEMKEYKRGMD